MAPVQISVSPVCPSITLNDQKNVNNFDFHTLNGTLQVYFVLITTYYPYACKLFYIYALFRINLNCNCTAKSAHATETETYLYRSQDSTLNYVGKSFNV
jgi:hypothetical protein